MIDAGHDAGSALIDAERQSALLCSVSLAVLGIGGDEVLQPFLGLWPPAHPLRWHRGECTFTPTVAEYLPTLLEGLRPS